MNRNNSAVVFPGQGSQRGGMGKDFCDSLKVSRETYEEASDTLGWDVAAMCFGNDERLNLTEYTQPCILTTEIAMLRALQSQYGFSPSFFGGHSLGEFTALVAANVLPLSSALRFVEIRGQLMQRAVPVGVGGMAAVISENLNTDLVRDTIGGLPLDVANINSAHQVVISGKLDAIPEAEKRFHEKLAGNSNFRFVPLKVSAPFHSHFMKPIEEPFKTTLLSSGNGLAAENAETVTSNFTGGFHSPDAGEIVKNLVFQLSNTVRWKDNMKSIASRTDSIYEVGPGRPLRDFFKTVGVNCVSVTSLSSAERTFSSENN
jgi:[acyl-carrier-protein] S-malonyltransferase/trans-AT polyketide synthase/acyltransferase/oxidoreductase domain-containing protein